MARKPWYKALFERDYHDTFYRAGPVPRSVEEEAERAAGQVDFIAKCLELPEGARVLDLCCGWGRLSIPLAQRGYRVTGLDLSKYHIRLAKKAAKLADVDIEWVNADMRKVPGRARYDAVMNCFTSFAYLETEAEDQRVLDGIRRALKPGGVFFIDTMNHDWLMSVFQVSEFRELGNGAFMMERRAYDIEAGRTNVDWFYQPKNGKRLHGFHSLRLYTFTELSAMLSKAGLTVVKTWGGFDGQPFSMRSPRMVVLAERT
ncbi:MAG: methyltransferase domain-containing protein [Chloroflexi bacterium]|nr:methyltransferase domain-containing protein [Chloroflexota bacterium]